MESQTALNIINALPIGSVIITKQKYVLEKLPEGWYRPGVDNVYPTPFATWLPATIIHSEVGAAE